MSLLGPDGAPISSRAFQELAVERKTPYTEVCLRGSSSARAYLCLCLGDQNPTLDLNAGFQGAAAVVSIIKEGSEPGWRPFAGDINSVRTLKTEQEVLIPDALKLSPALIQAILIIAGSRSADNLELVPVRAWFDEVNQIKLDALQEQLAPQVHADAAQSDASIAGLAFGSDEVRASIGESCAKIGEGKSEYLAELERTTFLSNLSETGLRHSWFTQALNRSGSALELHAALNDTGPNRRRSELITYLQKSDHRSAVPIGPTVKGGRILLDLLKAACMAEKGAN